jgi:hypothetical protein
MQVFHANTILDGNTLEREEGETDFQKKSHYHPRLPKYDLREVRKLNKTGLKSSSYNPQAINCGSNH